MKDWEARLKDLDRRLAEYEVAVTAEVKRLGKERKQLSFFKRPSQGELEALARDARAKLGEGPMVEVSAFFDELCRYFINPEGAESAIRERGVIRARLGQAEALFEAFWEYAAANPGLIRGPQDTERLELALAALSIDDARVDIELLREAMGRIYVAARRAGIDPKPHIEKIAAISNKGMTGGGAHMRSFLREFDSSAYFEQHVRPFLTNARAS